MEIRSPKECNLDRLDDINKLEKDWNGHGAESIPEKVIDIAKQIIKAVDMQPLYIYPTGRESVQLQYEYYDNYLEIEIFVDNTTIMFVPPADEIDCDGKDYDKAKFYTYFYTYTNNELDIDMLNFIINIFCAKPFVSYAGE